MTFCSLRSDFVDLWSWHYIFNYLWGVKMFIEIGSDLLGLSWLWTQEETSEVPLSRNPDSKCYKRNGEPISHQLLKRFSLLTWCILLAVCFFSYSLTHMWPQEHVLRCPTINISWNWRIFVRLTHFFLFLMQFTKISWAGLRLMDPLTTNS